MSERLPIRVWNDLKALLKNTRVASQAFQEIQKQYFLHSHVIVSNSKEINSLRLEMTCVMIGTQGALTLFGVYLGRRKAIQFCFGAGLIASVFVIQPLYRMFMLESVARTQSEAGEVARATILFKMPEHRLRREFEMMSKNYAWYAAAKRKELGKSSKIK